MKRRAAVELAMLATMLCGSIEAGTATAPSDAATQAKGAKVSVEDVSNRRIGNLLPPGQVDLKLQLDSILLVQLRFQGGPVKNVSRIGRAVVYEATDDLNESLVEESAASTRPAPEAKSEMHTVEEGVETDDAVTFGKIYVRLRSPARRAMKIARLRGEFPILAGGDRKTVEITDLPSRFGKFLNDPTLTQAGVKVWIDAKKESGTNDHTDLVFKLSGNHSAIRQVKVFDGNDEVSSGLWYSTPDPQAITIGRAITKQTVLRLFVVVNEKRVSVPFDLSNIPLP